MAIFGVKALDKNSSEYLSIVSLRLERSPVTFILDAGSKQKGDTFYFRVEPRLPKMYWLGIAIISFLWLIGWLKWWVILVVSPLLAWGLFWTPGVYYASMLWGFRRKYHYTGALQYVKTADVHRVLLPGRVR